MIFALYQSNNIRFLLCFVIIQMRFIGKTPQNELLMKDNHSSVLVYIEMLEWQHVRLTIMLQMHLVHHVKSVPIITIFKHSKFLFAKKMPV